MVLLGRHKEIRRVIWLDFKLFGNGNGMKSPFFDDTFYWLVDTNGKDRHGRNGRFYKWVGGFGAQLRSFEWTAPRAGTERELLGRRFRIFTVSRRGLRVEASWALAQSDTLTIEQIRELKADLQRDS